MKNDRMYICEVQVDLKEHNIGFLIPYTLLDNRLLNRLTLKIF